jgi:hypothetical protein
MRENDGYAKTVYGDYYWQINYTDANTNERKTYMNVAFESLVSAENELRIIKKQIEKMKGLGYYLNRTGEHKVDYVCTTGKNFRIKKKKTNW